MSDGGDDVPDEVHEGQGDEAEADGAADVGGADSAPRVEADAASPPGGAPAEAAEDAPPADDLGRFLDARRPWLRPQTGRDRRRRRASLYWGVVYVLLMAGITSFLSFAIVRGYLWLVPGPTNTGASVARRVVPWVLTVVYLAFAYYVTRNLRRLLVLGLLFLAPTAAFLFLEQATGLAEWVVGWIPGSTNVYGLAAFGPVVALVLLGFDFVRWQLWIEFPQGACWNCGSRIRDERWIVCPYCENDLVAQRTAADGDVGEEKAETAAPAAAVDEAAAAVEPHTRT